MTFTELCAGTGAVTFHLAGLKPPAPTAGSKRTYAPEILGHLGVTSPPSRASLIEPGEWGRTLPVILGRDREQVASQLEAWTSYGDRELFDLLRMTPADRCIGQVSWARAKGSTQLLAMEQVRTERAQWTTSPPAYRAAAHLYLQSRTYRGKPVSPKKDGSGWVTYGFDPEFRLAKTKASGAKDRGFYNARPVLAQKIRKLTPPFPISVCNYTSGAVVLGPADPGDVVYIDPPYQGSGVEYAHKLSRAEVVLLARMYARNGYIVGVSEAEPLKELTDIGWRAVKLKPYRGGVTFNTREEWLTLWKP